MAGPQVSVVTVFLDAERFLEEAVESVLEQTFDAWELILVDDGSTDNSTALARQYARRHPERIRYVEHPGHVRLGTSASRNLGIAHARGAYVAFLDANDAWLPRRLEAHVELLDRRPRAAMVYGPTLYWYSWADDPTEPDAVAEVGVPAETLFEPPYLLRRFLTSGGGILPDVCSLLVRRSVAGAVSGFEEAFRDAYADHAFLSKVCLRHPGYVTGACLARRRLLPDAHRPQAEKSDAPPPERSHPSRERYLNWLADYLTAHGVRDPALWAALHQELRPYRYPMLYRLERWWRGIRARRWASRNAQRAVRHVLPSSAYRWVRQRVAG